MAIYLLIRYGRGVTREVGDDLVDLGSKNVLVVTDPNLAAIAGGPVDVVKESLKRAKINFKVYEHVQKKKDFITNPPHKNCPYPRKFQLFQSCESRANRFILQRRN